MHCRLGSVVVAGCLLLGTSGFVDAAHNPIRRANSAFYLTHRTYDDTFDRLNERLGLNLLMRNPFADSLCSTPRCSTTKRYRTYSGACAGVDPVNRPLLGARRQCHERLLPPSFVDRVSEPPKWIDVASIFNVVQNLRVPSTFPRDNSPSGMFAMVGQFLADDISDTALARIVDPQRNFDCCDQAHRLLPQCSLRIDVSEALGYEDVGARCMSFVRAARCPCSRGAVRESMNLETAYIDLSHVYGDRAQRDDQEPWRLASGVGNASNGLPIVDPNPAVCYGTDCFRGDRRMNQEQGLSLHYVVFERLHNRMADELRKLKESWSPNRVFEEARKLVIARWQYVVFNEFLTLLIDSDELRKWHLDIDSLMAGTQPDPDARAVTYVESVYSAILTHGFVPDTFNKLPFVWLNSSSYLHTANFTSTMASAQWSTPGKPFFPLADSVGYNAFRHPDEAIGLSMLLIDVQRSRDTGMPSFRDVMEWAHNVTIDSFDSISELGVYTDDHLEVLRSIYNDRVDKVDMVVGGHLQLPYGTGVAPYVHQKINLEQFYGQAYGDRFFFSHRSVFTSEQRRAIADASSYAQILCESIEIAEVAKTPFVFRAEPAMIKCADVKPFNYEVFI